MTYNNINFEEIDIEYFYGLCERIHRGLADDRIELLYATHELLRRLKERDKEITKLKQYEQFYNDVVSKPDCNTCAKRQCEYMPKLGQITRFNCPLWEEKKNV